MSGHRPLLMQNITSFCTRQRPKVAWSNKSKMKIRKKGPNKQSSTTYLEIRSWERQGCCCHFPIPKRSTIIKCVSYLLSPSSLLTENQKKFTLLYLATGARILRASRLIVFFEQTSYIEDLASSKKLSYTTKSIDIVTMHILDRFFMLM